MTPEEIRILIEQGTETGVFEEAEQDMIESVLHLDERRVGSLMTPRTQIVWIDVEDSADVIREKVTSSRHSRFPVCEDSLENVLGILRTKDLLAQSLASQPLDLRSILQAPLFVPETTSALRMLELFKEQKRHIALVTDEFGSIQGVVTHNDILEAVVGVMPSAGEPAAPGAVRREDGSWLVDGLMDLDTFKALFEIEELPDEAQGIYQTAWRSRHAPDRGHPGRGAGVCMAGISLRDRRYGRPASRQGARSAARHAGSAAGFDTLNRPSER